MLDYRRLSIVIMCLLLFAFPLIFNSPYILQTAIMVIFFAYMSCSWNILGGLAGQVSLGHNAFAGIGAYVSTLLFMYAGLTPWLGMLVGGILAGMFALAIGYPCFRLKGTYFTLSTIAFASVLRIFVLANNKIFGLETRGAQGLIVPLKGNMPSVMQFTSKIPYYYIILVMLFLVIVITIYIQRSKMGYYLAAIRTNQEAAASLGINVSSYKLITSFISAFLTALGGSFYAQFILYIDPARLLGQDLGLEIVLIAIIGGQGSVFGPLLGALVLVPISEIARSLIGGQLPGLHVALYGLAMMVIIMFMPKGLIVPLGKLFRPLQGGLKAIKTT